MKKIAVFPGSFDPITIGHIDVLKRALPLFDEIIVAIGVNADKKYMFSLEDRKRFIEASFANDNKIQVKTYKGLTAKFCLKEKAQFILRGLRNTSDFNYEQPIAQTNALMTGVESIFIMCSPEVSNISSSIVRDVLRNEGDASKLVPEVVLK
ncbi:pantetheine-phosphate adenylyltransferase [Ulvibacter antarcticus]|uniref:Phosphopantetheine adenylyltransferase n=1 Tax=Ulvibacter antarcticus TaxID=442714 RepID=A0A3L9Y7W7_9FLAO|nr:pantetheine-phosphate adenylyltransferase [Ulvibacter antarcticus]RMA56811.1 phosphopantetheine adenylyltransferase [Ulvibacter antarcticus]